MGPVHNGTERVELAMAGHAAGFGGTAAATAAVGGSTGRGDGADGWPGRVSGGPVGRGVWAVLCASGSPLTVRQVAALLGTRRESAGRVLGQLEQAGWARRERGEVKAGVPDAWYAQSGPREQWLAQPRPDARLDEILKASAEGRRTDDSCGQPRMRAVGSAPPCVPGTSGEVAGPRRLAPGELRAQVLGLLRSRAPQELSPVQVARMLGGRSQGAVMNACKWLVANGEARCSCQAPLRYTAPGSSR